MISYILTTAAVIALSLLFYRAFLQRETFFRVNRIVLLSCLMLSFIIPLVRVPAKFSFRQAQATESIKELPATAMVPVIQPGKQAADIKSASIKQGVTASAPSVTFDDVFDAAIKYVPFIYWAGVAVMGINLLLQIIVLLYRSRKSRVIKDGLCRIVEVDDDRAPCSFANSIYINPDKYDAKTYSKILAHEKIHVLQRHSIDLLLAEAMLAFQWFNPLAWMYRKDIERNLEYLTDDSLLKDSSFERSDYQLSLLKVSVPNLALNVTTNYNRSMLKNRIVMMNAKRSNVNSTWKYLTLFLLMVVVVCNINEPLYAVTSNVVSLDNKNANESRSVITKDQPSLISQLPEGDQPKEVKIEKALITTPPALQTDTTHPLKFSNTTGRIEAFYEGGTIKMPFPDNVITADAAFVNAMGNLGYTSLSQGQMDSLKTAGVTPQFTGAIANMGYEKLPYKILCILNMSNVTPQYIQSFSGLGYGRLKMSKLITFKFSNVDAAYIKSLQNEGLTIPLDLVTIAKLKKITPEYIISFKQLGYKDLPYDRISMWKSQGIDAAYIKSFKDLGYSGLSYSNVSMWKSQGVDAVYIRSLKDLGYNDLPYSRVSMWKTQGIDANYIKGFNKIGYSNIPASDLSFLRSGKVTPEYITEMKEKGIVYTDIKQYAFARDRR